MKGTRATSLPLSAPPPMAIAHTVAQKIIWKMLKKAKSDQQLLPISPNYACNSRKEHCWNGSDRLGTYTTVECIGQVTNDTAAGGKGQTVPDGPPCQVSLSVL